MSDDFDPPSLKPGYGRTPPSRGPLPGHDPSLSKPANTKRSKREADGRNFAKTFTDDPRWEELIWRWVDGTQKGALEKILTQVATGDITVEEGVKKVRASVLEMPAGVFNTIMQYRFGKPPQTVKLKGDLGAKPYDGLSDSELAARAADLATELAVSSAAHQLDQERAAEAADQE
jgi:hypothetical protein